MPEVTMSSRAAEILSAPWWKQILMGVSTAIPHEWEQEDGSLKLAGESAAEFMSILEEHNIQPTEELLEACNEYVVRVAIKETGEHPNASPGWEDTYE
jgi:hypothetical protein